MAITSVLLALFFSGLQAAVPPQTTTAPKIETVEVRNNRRIPGDTIKYNIQTKAGDTLNPETKMFLDQSAAPCLTKPCTVAEIRRAIQQVLETR